MTFHPVPVDLLVIGGGMAGTMAAVTAARRGLRVALVRKSYGATALSSGAVDFRALLPLAGAGVIREAVAAFKTMMAEVGLPYAGDPDQPATLLTALGTARAACLYPQTAAAGAVAGGLPGARVCFVGVRGQADYNAAFVARSVGRLSATGVLSARFETASVEFAMPGVRHPYNRNAMELAQLLDDESTLAEATAALREALPGDVTDVALPPIWGVERAPQALSATQAALGVPCFEPLAVPPSVPGFRLQRALDRALERGGVRVIHATVTGFVAEERWITRVEATEKETRYAFIPQAVVLATGKFVGGGVARDEHLRETVLGLPVFVGDEIVTDQPVQEYLAPQFGDDQPLMRAGVRVDDSLRPVDGAGNVIYENVWAAGGVRAGYPADHGALGAALVEGFWLAARLPQSPRSFDRAQDRPQGGSLHRHQAKGDKPGDRLPQGRVASPSPLMGEVRRG